MNPEPPSFQNVFLQSVSFLVPLAVTGNVLDRYVSSLQSREKLGKNVLTYLSFQTILLILIVHGVLHIGRSYGIRDSFVCHWLPIFFLLQTNYVSNWQRLLNEELREETP